MTSLPTPDPALSARALLCWGKFAQATQALEELHELSCELHHLGRGREVPGLAEEIADVLICLGQLALLAGEEEVARQVKAKEERLRTHLADMFGEAK